MAEPGQSVEAPWSGAVPAGGLPAVIRIPVPGPGNFALAVKPPSGWKGPSTSSIFIMEGKHKGLRLDYGFNKSTNTCDYHWNRQKTGARFPIANHAPAGRVGAILHNTAKAFRYGGRIFVVLGVAADAVSILRASNPLRRSTQVVSAWAMAWLGARTAGSVGFAAGEFVNPLVGGAVGGIVFGIAGGVGGYWAGSKAGVEVYDWAESTIFTPLQSAPLPADAGKMLE